jgi:hypothetical protein
MNKCMPQHTFLCHIHKRHKTTFPPFYYTVADKLQGGQQQNTTFPYLTKLTSLQVSSTKYIPTSNVMNRDGWVPSI